MGTAGHTLDDPYSQGGMPEPKTMNDRPRVGMICRLAGGEVHGQNLIVDWRHRVTPFAANGKAGNGLVARVAYPFIFHERLGDAAPSYRDRIFRRTLRFEAILGRHFRET